MDARGVEIVGRRRCSARSRAASRSIQGDIDQGLADYPDQAFDYVILSQTLQEVAQAAEGAARDAARRPARHRGVSEFRPLARAPGSSLVAAARRNQLFPHDWYDSPNIHFLTVHDFEALAQKETWTVERAIYLSADAEVRRLPNLMAEVAVFLIRK